MPVTLDITLLRTFHCVARLGQFRAAAVQVNKSPAAVSVQIQRLEEIAGGKLLERDNQSVTLTPLGQKLLATTAVLLKAHDDILDDLHETAVKGRIRLGIPDEYATPVIRNILPAFTALCPEVELEVLTASSQLLMQQIGRNQLDLAVVVQPGISEKGALQRLAVTLPVWVAGRHFILRHNEPVPLALHAAHCPYREAMTTSLALTGQPWKVILTSPSARAVEACVEAGLGISLIDRGRVSASMQILHSFPQIAPHEILLLRSSSANAEPAASVLEEMVQNSFKL